MKQQPDFSSHVQGIPCGILIDTFIHVKPFKGPAALCASDVEYYGYTEIEFSILDRKGYQAPWLLDKMDDLDKERIEEEIFNYKMGDTL